LETGQQGKQTGEGGPGKLMQRKREKCKKKEKNKIISIL
jgi:hypothetical protein